MNEDEEISKLVREQEVSCCPKSTPLTSVTASTTQISVHNQSIGPACHLHALIYVNIDLTYLFMRPLGAGDPRGLAAAS